MEDFNEMCTNVPATTDKEVDGSSGKIEVNGVELYFERYGNGPHAILCIPGALGGSVFFTPQAKYFGQSGSRYTLIAYDPRGYGRSRPHSRIHSSPQYYQTDATDAVGLMKALKFEKFSILGWCEGGTCAIIAAAIFPEVVKNVVVWGSRAYLEKTDIALFENIKNLNNWNPKIRSTIEKYYGQDLPMLWGKWHDTFISICFDPVRQGDICKKEVSMVQCPTLIVHGDDDPLLPSYQIDFLRKNFQNCRYEIIPGGGHSIHLKLSSKFNHIADEFLSN